MIAIWSGSDESSSKEEMQEEANLRLIAQEDEVTSETKFEFSFNEL